MNLGKETELQEFKLSTAQTSRALETLSAMLNKHGRGTVYFGVDDNGDVVGVTLGNKTIKDLSEAITSRIKPTVIPTIEIRRIDGKDIIICTVEGYNKPYAADGNYLIRSGSENKKIEPEQLKHLLFTNSIELITNIEAFNQDLTFNQLKQLFMLKGLTVNDEAFEKNTGLLCKNKKYNQLADMLSDNNDYSIKVVRFSGTDKSDMVLRNEYGYKCLLLSMQQVLDYVNSLNETKVELDGSLTRKEKYLFDSKSLREAWINACLHCRWDKMVPPAIYIFNNRIEIVSTGGLPVDYSVEDFFSGISHPINRQLQKIMGQLGIVEQTGHGVPEIVKNYGKEAFRITDNNIIVTLKFAFEPTTSYSINRNKELTLSQKKVFDAISVKPTILTRELVSVTGLKISRINVLIRELKDLGVIERVGANKNGYWKIKSV